MEPATPDPAPELANTQASSLEPPTPRQREVLLVIQKSIAERGFPPTIREIVDALGIRSTNAVADLMRELERKGHLRRDGIKSRAVVLLHAVTQTDPVATADTADTATPVAPSAHGDHCALASEVQRLRSALEKLTTFNWSEFSRFGSAGAMMVGDNVAQYAREALGTAMPEPPELCGCNDQFNERCPKCPACGQCPPCCGMLGCKV